MASTQATVNPGKLSGKFTSLLPETKSVVVMISGLPGTGKSFFSRRLAERLHFYIIESDAIRKELFSKPTYSAAESTQLFHEIHQRIEERLQKGISIILDATNLVERHRKSVYRIAERYGASTIIVQVEAPPELVRKRLVSRAKGAHDKSDADWAVYQKMKSSAEKIKLPHFICDSARDINPVIDKIIKEVNRLKGERP